MLFAQNVIIENADELGGTPEERILEGNVRLRQDTITLLCGRAVLTGAGSFTAEGGTLTLFGQSGRIRAARLRYDPTLRRLTYEGSVIADFPPARLQAPRLHYDREVDIVWYEGGGIFSDTTGEIHSEKATYDTRSEVATFAGQVRLFRESTQAATDTLIYEVQQAFARFPRFVQVWDTVRRDTLTAFSAAWNRHTGEVFLYEKAHYRDTARLVWAAGAYYAAEQDSGWAACDVRYQDRQGSIFGWADSAGWQRDSLILRDNAALMYIENETTDTTFLQASTIHAAGGRAYAFGQAELMRPPYYARSETLWYDTLADVAHLRGQAWLTDSLMQLYAYRIELLLRGKKPDFAFATGQVGFIWIAEPRLDFYHQVSSDSAVAMWDTNGILEKAYFWGGTQVVYYLSEGKKWRGVHYAQVQHLYAEMDSTQKPLYVRLIEKPRGVYYPIHKVMEAPLWIRGLRWMPAEEQPYFPFRLKEKEASLPAASEE